MPPNLQIQLPFIQLMEGYILETSLTTITNFPQKELVCSHFLSSVSMWLQNAGNSYYGDVFNWGQTSCCNCIVLDWCSYFLQNSSRANSCHMLQTKDKTILESSPFHFVSEAHTLDYLILKRDVRKKIFVLYCGHSNEKCKLKIPLYFLVPNERKTQPWWITAKKLNCILRG